MDTSKNYYESFMRDFQMYGRGRTLEQYCRDEGADFKWFEKAKELYEVPVLKKEKASKRTKKCQDKAVDMIQLHFDPGINETEGNDDSGKPTESIEQKSQSEVLEWKVASLKVTTPMGYEIEIMATNPAAVSELLAKLTA